MVSKEEDICKVSGKKEEIENEKSLNPKKAAILVAKEGSNTIEINEKHVKTAKSEFSQPKIAAPVESTNHLLDSDLAESDCIKEEEMVVPKELMEMYLECIRVGFANKIPLAKEKASQVFIYHKLCINRK